MMSASWTLDHPIGSAIPSTLRGCVVVSSLSENRKVADEGGGRAFGLTARRAGEEQSHHVTLSCDTARVHRRDSPGLTGSYGRVGEEKKGVNVN